MKRGATSPFEAAVKVIFTEPVQAVIDALTSELFDYTEFTVGESAVFECSSRT